MGLNHRSVIRKVAIAACVLATLAGAGCKEVQDIREELGWAKQEAPKPAPPPVASLDSHWLPADAVVADLNQAQWSARWWRWVGHFDDINAVPQRDPNGRQCALHQDGPVWFLAGTDGTFDAVRTCVIPADKHLFVPVINWVVHRGLQDAPMSCADKQAEAANRADHVVTGLVLLDGRPVGELQRMRVASGGCFEMSAGNPASASDGYWLMLKPLPPGKHQLAIAAAYREGARQSMQNFRYELDVQAVGTATADTAGGAAAAAGAVQ